MVNKAIVDEFNILGAHWPFELDSKQDSKMKKLSTHITEEN